MRVLLADDEVTVRQALRLLLEQELGFQIAGEAADTSGLLQTSGQVRPELVLLDWELPGQEEGALVTWLSQALVHLLVIAMSSRPEAKQAALAAGVHGFISKTMPAEQVLAVLHTVVGQRAGGTNRRNVAY